MFKNNYEYNYQDPMNDYDQKITKLLSVLVISTMLVIITLFLI